MTSTVNVLALPFRPTNGVTTLVSKFFVWYCERMIALHCLCPRGLLTTSVEQEILNIMFNTTHNTWFTITDTDTDSKHTATMHIIRNSIIKLHAADTQLCTVCAYWLVYAVYNSATLSIILHLSTQTPRRKANIHTTTCHFRRENGKKQLKLAHGPTLFPL